MSTGEVITQSLRPRRHEDKPRTLWVYIWFARFMMIAGPIGALAINLAQVWWPSLAQEITSTVTHLVIFLGIVGTTFGISGNYQMNTRSIR